MRPHPTIPIADPVAITWETIIRSRQDLMRIRDGLVRVQSLIAQSRHLLGPNSLEPVLLRSLTRLGSVDLAEQ
jgi:hypothetical protein